MFEQRHKAFDEVAERGPYAWGFGQIFQDPYFNPFPEEQKPEQPAEKPSEPEAQEKPAAKPAEKSAKKAEEPSAKSNYYSYSPYY